MDFKEFPKIARLSREVIVTEKIDGTNGLIAIGDDGGFQIGSRSRWLTPETGDNHGFMLWALTNKDELMKLGPGFHYGEWWGSGIQRGYGLQKGEKRFSLFNVSRWADDAVRPPCCGVVPILQRVADFGLFDVHAIMDELKAGGSLASPGFRKPEGIVIFHAQGNVLFKKTFDKDDAGKNYGA